MIRAMKLLFGWLARKAVLYGLLVIAIAGATILAPWLQQMVAGWSQASDRAEALGDVAATIARERDAAARAFRADATRMRSSTLAELVVREVRLRRERAELSSAIEASRPAWLLALSDRGELLTNERRKLRVAWIDQELPVVATARNAIVSNGASRAAQASLREQQARVDRAVPLCNAAVRQLRAYEGHWSWRLRSWLESAEHRTLTARRDLVCNEARAAIRQRNAEAAFARAASRTEVIARAGADIAADAERARIELAGSQPEKLRLWSENIGLSSLLRQAAIALAVIIATPFLIRLFCYYVLAPLAMRRPPIRLSVPGGAGKPIPLAAPSGVSVGIRLAPDEELLVRQDYLQTSSLAGAKDTQWFLDWRKPFTSLATGLTFLTRIRGAGELTTVSAVRDTLAEVTIVTLPDGAACVFHPRALAAVTQPIGRRLRITRHWRLGTLDAWLTLQLRFLVFHGPARLVVKGGRGVRVERAEQGRVFGQDQLVGFSAGLAYSVTRTETFWPYFLGREPLLKDRVRDGEGVIIIEEAPLSSRRGAGRHGIEGMMDAGMKVFGM